MPAGLSRARFLRAITLRRRSAWHDGECRLGNERRKLMAARCGRRFRIYRRAHCAAERCEFNFSSIAIATVAIFECPTEGQEGRTGDV